jgi:hypothetical protein
MQFSRHLPPLTWWTAQRFGFTPDKLRHALFPRTNPGVFCVSLPKAGTHLLERALCLHPLLSRKLLPTINNTNITRWRSLDLLLRGVKPGQLLVSHLTYSDHRHQAVTDSGMASLFLVRDPRDIVVSSAFYIMKNAKHHLHQLFQSLPDDRARIALLVRGDAANGVSSIAERLERFSGWLTAANLVVRFEDLVGAQGGGDDRRQEKTLRSIFHTVGVDLDDQHLATIRGHLFSSASPTFRKGAVGEGKRWVTAEIEAIFQETAGPFLTRYGYHGSVPA